MKRCTKCSVEQPLTSFNKNCKAKDGLRTHCKTCRRAADKIFHQIHKTRRRNYNFKKAYGLSYQQIITMLENQNKLCPICGIKMHMGRKNDSRAVVDHSHETSEVRGIICSGCNQMLGKAKDNIWTLHNAIQYLSGVPRKSSEIKWS